MKYKYSFQEWITAFEDTVDAVLEQKSKVGLSYKDRIREFQSNFRLLSFFNEHPQMIGILYVRLETGLPPVYYIAPVNMGAYDDVDVATFVDLVDEPEVEVYNKEGAKVFSGVITPHDKNNNIKWSVNHFFRVMSHIPRSQDKGKLTKE